MAGLPTRIARLDDGRIAFRLSPAERVILGGYLAGLRDRIAPAEDAADADGEADGDAADDDSLDAPAPARDAVRTRLDPDAIPGDPAASAAFRNLVGRELVQGRLARLDTVAETLDATTLDDAGAAAWLGALNDLRLVIGTELDIRGDDSGEIDEQDPDAERRLVYAYAAWLQDQLVGVLADALPFVPDDEDRVDGTDEELADDARPGEDGAATG